MRTTAVAVLRGSAVSLAASLLLLAAAAPAAARLPAVDTQPGASLERAPQAAAATATNGLIAYVASRMALPPFTDGAGIWVANPDGSARRLVSPPTYQGLALTPGAPAWSPDGTRLAFVGLICPVGGGVCAGRRIFVMNADGTGLRVLADDPWRDDARPSWSPDGSEVAFVAYDGEYVIRVARVDGGGERVLVRVSWPMRLGPPAWSPARNTIAYNRIVPSEDPRGPVERTIWAVNVDGSSPRLLLGTSGADYGELHGWAPDGRRLLISRGAAFRPERHMLVADLSGAVQPVPYAGYLGPESPRWSPDGKSIVLEEVSCSGVCERNGIRVLTIDPAVRGAYPRGRLIAPGNSPDWQPCRRAGGCLLAPRANRPPTIAVPRVSFAGFAGGRAQVRITFVACDELDDQLALVVTPQKVGLRYAMRTESLDLNSHFPRRTARCQQYTYTWMTPRRFTRAAVRGQWRVTLRILDDGTVHTPPRRSVASAPVVRTVRIP